MFLQPEKKEESMVLRLRRSVVQDASLVVSTQEVIKQRASGWLDPTIWEQDQRETEHCRGHTFPPDQEERLTGHKDEKVRQKDNHNDHTGCCSGVADLGGPSLVRCWWSSLPEPCSGLFSTTIIHFKYRGYKMSRPAYILGSLLLVIVFYFIYLDRVSRMKRLEDYIRPTSWLIENHRNQVATRRSYMSQIPNVSTQVGWGHLYNNLAPEVFCAEKIKVGTTDDGGKWMCSPQKLPKDCVVFALGISEHITFEEDIQRYSEQRCKIISVDSVQQTAKTISALKEIRGEVVKAFISDVDKDEKMTMDTILKTHGASSIEILKIDIEGSEFAVMETLLKQYRPAQIMIEVHGDPAQTFNFIKMISSKGYHLFNYEINGQYHVLAEYAFIHESAMERYGATMLGKYL